jgi:hypothetical protein
MVGQFLDNEIMRKSFNVKPILLKAFDKVCVVTATLSSPCKRLQRRASVESGRSSTYLSRASSAAGAILRDFDPPLLCIAVPSELFFRIMAWAVLTAMSYARAIAEIDMVGVDVACAMNLSRKSLEVVCHLVR